MSIFSKAVKGIGHAVGHAAGQVGHVATDVGHGIGDALDNKYVKAGLGAALTATGVGAPLAIGLMAGEGALGGAMKRGGGLKSAAGGALSGAESGAMSGIGGGAGHATGLGQMAGNFARGAGKSMLVDQVSKKTGIPSIALQPFANKIPGLGLDYGSAPGKSFAGASANSASSPNAPLSVGGGGQGPGDLYGTGDLPDYNPEDFSNDNPTGSNTPNTGAPGGTIAQSGTPASPSSPGTDGESIWGKIGGGIHDGLDYLNKNKGVLGMPLAIAQGANAAYLNHKATSTANDALGNVQHEWDLNAPLRDSARARLAAPRSIDPNMFFNQPGGGPSLYHRPLPVG